MKSSTTHNLRFALIRGAMLAAAFTIGLLPTLSATANFRPTKLSSLSGPTVDVLHYGALTVGPRISVTTAEAVTQASIMWGSFVLKKPTPSSGRGPATHDPSAKAD
jgi:hypothetical protein